MARQPINAPVGQKFGSNPKTYAHLGMSGHNGWDYPAPLNTPIYAPESGKVEQRVDPSGYGRNLYLVGDSGWHHVLAHQQSFAVGNGRVSEGQLVGYVNSTGFSTGNHLHWGTRPARYNQKNGYYGYVDPQIFLNEQKGASSLPYSDEYVKDMEARFNAGSVEIKRNLIADEYRLYLGRNPKEDEYKHWVNKTPKQITDGIRSSAEAKAFNSTGYGDSKNELPTEQVEPIIEKLKNTIVDTISKFKP